MKKTLWIAALIIITLIGFWFVNKSKSGGGVDYKSATYLVEGHGVELDSVNTRYFGNEAKGDLNMDGRTDLAFIITQSPGGSGTFYYVVAALQNSEGGYVGTNAVLLGDRVAPQTTEIRDGELIVNYAERKPSEPMTTKPSQGVSKYLKVQNNSLVEISHD